MNVKLLSPTAKLPVRGSVEAAGLDLCADSDSLIMFNPFETKLIGTGIAAEIPYGCFGAVFARSGLATKKGLRPANAVGVIDSDYRGEIKVALHNDSDKIVSIEPFERIAQLVVIPCMMENVNVVDELNSTDRGSNGFGSTGTV